MAIGCMLNFIIFCTGVQKLYLEIIQTLRISKLSLRRNAATDTWPTPDSIGELRIEFNQNLRKD